MINSLLAAAGHAVLVLITASMAAYPLARMNFRGKNVIFAIIIGTLFVPSFIFLMPNYLMMDRLAWLDTLIALIVPGAAGAFGVFFLRQFFLSIPRELEESARVDGANTWQILTRIILPISKPALVTLGLIAFLPTGTSSSGRSSYCSHPNGSRCRPVCRRCRPRTTSTIQW